LCVYLPSTRNTDKTHTTKNTNKTLLNYLNYVGSFCLSSSDIRGKNVFPLTSYISDADRGRTNRVLSFLPSAKTCLDPRPRPPSVMWSPTPDAQWTLCCPWESPGGKKCPITNTTFPKDIAMNNRDYMCVEVMVGLCRSWSRIFI